MTIILPDGYNGDTVECELDPVKIDGDLVQLKVKGSYMTKWVTRKQWENAKEA